MKESDLFAKCEKRVAWCARPGGVCILVVAGECRCCEYFRKDGEK